MKILLIAIGKTDDDYLVSDFSHHTQVMGDKHH